MKGAKISRSQTLRQILASGPSTCHEIAASTGLSLRRARIAVWVLTSQGHAKIVGRLPREAGQKGHGHNLYGLTPRGHSAFRRREARMSAQTIHDAFEPVIARYRAEQLKATWGHLAPKKNGKYEGSILFAIGCFGSDHLNPTVLSCELGDLDSSPWFYDALMEFLSDGQHCDEESSAFKIGNVYRFDGYFKNYEFVGVIRQLALAATPAK